MGGKVFSTGPDALHTPRMPKAVYLSEKARCLSLLRSHFDAVDSPIDGPAKDDFGDIDFLLCGPKDPSLSRDEIVESLKNLLAATRVVVSENGADLAAHLAVPWPRDDDVDKENAEEVQAESDVPRARREEHDTPEPKHMQVDVRLCESMERMRWMLFRHAHGDIWNILGSTIRPYGLTVDEHALWLRVPEIEGVNRKRAKVFLTNDPGQVLDFLGLDPKTYWRGPFSDATGLFEYAAHCRMFRVFPAAEVHDASSSADAEAQQAAEDTRRLNSNDRRRKGQRSIFRRWLDEFLPDCRRRGRFLEAGTSREQVTREALATFGAEQEYNRRQHEFLLEKQRGIIWNDVIKNCIPQPDDAAGIHAQQQRSMMIKAFKRIILEDDGGSYDVRRPDDMMDGTGFFNLDRVAEFISDNKEHIRGVVAKRQKEAYLERVRVREEKARNSMQQQQQQQQQQ